MTFDFGEVPPLPACSTSECPNGHKWMPLLQIGQCPGCKAPLLALKMVNCPICNEPVAKLMLRVEHLPQGGTITALCAGHATLNDVTIVELLHQHAQQEQEQHVEREMPQKV